MSKVGFVQVWNQDPALGMKLLREVQHWLSATVMDFQDPLAKWLWDLEED